MRFKDVKRLIKESEENLFEVNMSPGNLQSLVSKMKGVQAGMEFEMIVPGVKEGYDDFESERDYDRDESVRDIDDAVSFFDDGDYNSSRDVRSLRESMEEDYRQWVEEKIDSEWQSDGFEYFQQWLDNNDSYDRDEGLEAAEDYVRENNPDLEPGTDEYSEAVSERLNELEANYAVEQWEYQGRNYDSAREEFEDEKRGDYSESDWLDDQGIHSMTDVENTYDMQWPHWTSYDPDDDEGDIAQVADDFSRAIGKKTNWSRDYHGGRREPDAYVVEPDGSLDADDAGEAGLEFVSPPMPVADLIKDLNKVKKWADRYGCYTNDSTGLHINISVPDYDLSKLDYVKLALLMGDEYVLKEFGRLSNSYARSALGKIRNAVKTNPAATTELLKQMRQHMDGLATKSIHSGQTDKYTSINTKSGYIEFRSPGGDWLNDNFEKIESTLLRFTVALDAAMNPVLYRKEYQKKLYKLLEPAKDEYGDMIKEFSDYVSGVGGAPEKVAIDFRRASLRALKMSNAKRIMDKAKASGKSTGLWWWNVKLDGQRVEVVAKDTFGAWQAALDTNPEWMRFNRANADIDPIRPYEEQPQQQGITVAGRPNNPEGNWYLKNSDTNEIFYRFNAANYQDAHTVLQQWKQENTDSNINAVYGHGRDEPAQQDLGNYIGIRSSVNRDQFRRGPDGEVLRFPSVEQAYGYMDRNNLSRSEWRISDLNMVDDNLLQPQASTPATTQQSSTGNWGIWISTSERFARLPGEYPAGQEVPLRRFASREAVDAYLAQTRENNPRMRMDIEAREIPSDYQSPAPAGRQVQPQQSGVTNLTPRGPGPWEVANVLNNQVYYNPAHTNRMAAETEARTWLTQNGYNPVQFEVRTREMVNAPQTLTRPGQGQQVFTGEWKVVDPQGREIYRFSGVGNNQADANRIAIQWLRDNPRHMQGGVEVLPVMS